MLAILYKFNVKPDQEQEFIKAWKELTEFIYEHRNSLGSRLHEVNESTFIAYAQWPDKSNFHDQSKKLPSEAELSKTKMYECCENIETLYEMEVVEDLFKDC